MSKNYYEILNLKRDCTPEEVAQSYQRMVLRWHPKFAKEDHKTSYHYFSQISEAYEVLSDPVKRAFYDKYGWEKLRQGLFSEGQLKGGYRFGNNPDEIFEKFFYGNNTFAKVFDKETVEKGSLFSHAFGALKYKDQAQYQDLRVNVPCTLNELYQGVAKQITYQRKVLNADGRTTSLATQTKLVEIKPGYSPSSIIKYPGQGHESVHRVTTDLICIISEIPDKKYERINNDLVYHTQVSLAQALDCKAVQLMTLDNRKLRVSIDQIVNPQTLKQVIGEGMPLQGDLKMKGNLYIKFNIVFPKQLSQQKKEQLRKLLP